VKIAIIYNKDLTGVINTFGIQNKETYNPATVKRVANALIKGGHNVEILDGNMHIIESLHEFMPRVIDGEQMGMVFNMAYGIQGESRYTHIPSLLEMLGIPYVGSNPSGHALALDKVITKIMMQRAGIPTPDFWVFSSNDENMDEVIFPAIVKPKMESVSFGLRVVNDQKELKEAVGFIIEEFQQQALVEQFIRGREFAIGLIGNNPVEAFPVLEFDMNNDPDAIQSLDNKRTSVRKKICPTDIPEDIAGEMVKQSIAAFKTLQLRDFARVDIRMDSNNNFYLLEINSMASLGETGSYPFAAAVAGYDYNALVNKMLDTAVVRYFANSTLLSEDTEKQKKIPLATRVRGFIRSRQEYLEGELEKMININTHAKNIPGITQLSNIIKKHMGTLGFEFEVIPQVDTGNIYFYTNNGNENYDILLLTCLDNPEKSSQHEYFGKTEQKITGTGSWENKGGLIVMLAALQALKFTRLLKKLKIGVLLTTDSTLQSKISKSIIRDKAQDVKYIIGLHGASPDSSIITSRSGAAVYKCAMSLTRNDESEHVPLAVSTFAKLINTWADITDKEKGVVVAPSEMMLQSNITHPFAHGEATLSVRFNDTDDYKNFDEKIKNAIPKKHKSLLRFQIDGGIRRPAMKETEKITAFWEIIKNLANKLDIRIIKGHRWSSADICFIEGNKHIVDGMGPVGNKPQKNAEYILRHSIIEKATLLAMTLYEISIHNAQNTKK